MFEALFVAGGLGFILGNRYRVPAVVVASVLVGVGSPVVAYAAGASLWTMALAPLVALVGLQSGYLVGVLSTFVTESARLRHSKAEHHAQGGLPTR